MSALRLKTLLCQAGIAQVELGRHLGLSKTSISHLLGQGKWPADRAGCAARIREFLQTRGIDDARALETEAPRRANAAGPIVSTTNEGDASMVLRKTRISETARRHFELSRDPFADPREPADLYLGSEIRVVREWMLDRPRCGGLLAVIGESGAGKTTLREELLERIERDLPGTIVIQPYIVAMEDSDSRGKPMRAMHIAESIMAAVEPLAPMRSSPEARWSQLHRTLRDSARTNNRHLLIIEEAHSMPVATLCHLKRLIELKDGLRPLLSIMLLGQPELELKLSDRNPKVRELVQRCEIVRLAPLAAVGDFLRHRFARAGSDLARVMDAGAIDAVVQVLGTPTQGRGSLLYPLAVQNLVAAAINAAAEDFQAPRVTADMVRGL